MRQSIHGVLQKTVLVVTAFILLSFYSSEISNGAAAGKSFASPAITSSRGSQAKGKDVDPTTRAFIEESYGKLPLSFEVNKGQADDAVRFISRGNGITLFLTSTEAVLSLRRGSSKEKEQIFIHGPQKDGSKLVTNDVIRLKAIGANPNPKITGLDELPGKSSYFIGNDPAKWRTGVSNFEKVKLGDVYPGIDLIYYGNQRQLEYDWIVNPGANPGVIKFAVEGKANLTMDEQGGLILKEKDGLRLNKPFIYQRCGGSHTEIAGRYILLGKQEVGFQLGKYDASLPLVIDPVLSYSTYLGGDGNNGAFSIAVDSSGNAYMTGYTTATNFPTANPIQERTGYTNIFVTKLNASGSALVYSTYIGGSYVFPGYNSTIDIGYGIAVDSSGNAYVTGATTSGDFPTVNPFQASNSLAPYYDAFVTKLNASGSALIYSTYLGGATDDFGYGIAVDSSGNAYVTGKTQSYHFPTAGAFQAIYGGGTYDAFVTKLNASGSALVYSTYLGGTSDEIGGGIVVDSSGNSYVTGTTASSDFPTANPFQASYGGGTYDAFVTKLNASGGALVYSTYLGGTGNDSGSGIAVDSSGNAYVTGGTDSSDFPTANAFQASYGGGGDAYVAKLNASGSALIYSTYLGGTSGEGSGGIAVDS
ncbi:MAG TPA: SBBP repeat-containing protein, partial [Acidobacteriota bacterium]|nr:SBBP repeat-containing protein [Acidobacteriota bacterium]